MNDLEVIKGLAGMGTLGVAIGVGYFLYTAAVKFLDKQQVASDRKDDLFAATLKESAADLKAALAEVKTGLETVGKSVVEVDRGHVEHARETFESLLEVNDKQHAALNAMTAQIAELKSEVANLSRTKDPIP
jgi:phosphoenolpyruvate-protein kinase (PTS system EI component)